MTSPISTSSRLAGKTVIITGIGSGQGAAAAHLFAAEGAHVIGCDLQAEPAQDVVDRIRAANGRADDAVAVDLGDSAAVTAWAADVRSRHTHVDVLYVNAAATRFGPIENVSAEDRHWNFRNEVDVAFFPVREFWPLLRASGTASIVLVGSTAGVTGSMTNTRIAHTATKGAVVAMTKQLAAECAPLGIRVNCVSPGLIRTPATEGELLSPDHPMRTIERSIPLGRLGTPEDVARTALFLASDEAAYVTGTNLMVDGGWSAVLPG
ncbi:MAG: SDR family NAD(P)-dependent oxidoreductase [Galactobacter sp.]